jgi:hypothetical protein
VPSRSVQSGDQILFRFVRDNFSDGDLGAALEATGIDSATHNPQLFCLTRQAGLILKDAGDRKSLVVQRCNIRTYCRVNRCR